MQASDVDAVLAAVEEELGRLAHTPTAGAVARQLEVLGELVHAARDTAPAPDSPRELNGALGHPNDTPLLAPESLTRYLRARTGDGEAAVFEVVALPGGHSKLTTTARCRVNGDDLDIVLRQVPPGRPAERLAPEFAVLRWAWEAALPVAEPLWIEPVDNELGGPFFVTRRAAGTNVGDVWGASSATVESLCDELAEVLARLHTSPAADLDQTPVRPMRTAADVQRAIVELEEMAERSAPEGSPVLAALFGWLRRSIPCQTPSAVLVHGDVGFHNILAAEGRLTVLLDWERAHLGSPVEDLAYVRPSVEPVFAWSAFVGALRCGRRARTRQPRRAVLRRLAGCLATRRLPVIGGRLPSVPPLLVGRGRVCQRSTFLAIGRPIGL